MFDAHVKFVFLKKKKENDEYTFFIVNLYVYFSFRGVLVILPFTLHIATEGTQLMVVGLIVQLPIN